MLSMHSVESLLGPSTTRNHKSHRGNWFVHGRRAEAARLAVGDQPADPAARRRAEGAGLPARRAAHPHHAGRRIAAAAEPSGVPGSQGHDRRHHRQPGVAARHGPPARRHDGLSLRVSAAAHRAEAAASGNRPEADDRQLRTLPRAAARRRRRPRAADPAGRAARPGDGAGAAGGAAGGDRGQASAVAQAQGRCRRTWSVSRSCCSSRARTPAARSTSSS